MTVPTTPSPLDQPSRRAWVRARPGAWAAVATLATYWGLSGAGLLLRALNDPALDLPNQLFDKVIWGAYFKGGQIFQGDARGRVFRRVT